MPRTKGKTKGRHKGTENLIPIKKGERRNPNGRPKGQRNYRTIYREVIKKIGESQKMTPEEIEDLIHKSGIVKAMKGDYSFHKDVLDRLHGKPPQGIGGMDEEGNFKEQNLTIEFVKVKK